jgi:hypothetical protein
VNADQRARGRYLGGIVPFGFRRGDDAELVLHKAEQDAIRDMVALQAQGRPLSAIAVAGRQDQPRAGVLRSQRAGSGYGRQSGYCASLGPSSIPSLGDVLCSARRG